MSHADHLERIFGAEAFVTGNEAPHRIRAREESGRRGLAQHSHFGRIGAILRRDAAPGGDADPQGFEIPRRDVYPAHEIAFL